MLASLLVISYHYCIWEHSWAHLNLLVQHSPSCFIHASTDCYLGEQSSSYWDEKWKSTTPSLLVFMGRSLSYMA